MKINFPDLLCLVRIEKYMEGNLPPLKFCQNGIVWSINPMSKNFLLVFKSVYFYSKVNFTHSYSFVNFVQGLVKVILSLFFFLVFELIVYLSPFRSGNSIPQCTVTKNLKKKKGFIWECVPCFFGYGKESRERNRDDKNYYMQTVRLLVRVQESNNRLESTDYYRILLTTHLSV